MAYNALRALAPVCVVEVRDPTTGPFTVRRYRGGDWRPSPPRVDLEPVAVCAGWEAFAAWERSLRSQGGGGRV